MALHTGMNGWKFSDDVLNELWRKTDAELRLVISESASKILTTTGNLGIHEEYDVKERSAAANYILKEKETRPKVKKKIEETREKEKEAFLLQLKAAHTPNGQLVVSILEEEDGKTKEEIMAWCDELLSMDEQEMEILLQGLCEDGIIFQKEDQRYYLYHVCNGDLEFPDDITFKSWAYRIIQNDRELEDSHRIPELYNLPLDIVYSTSVWDSVRVFNFEDTLHQVDYMNEELAKENPGNRIFFGPYTIRNNTIKDSSVLALIQYFAEIGVLMHKFDNNTEYFWIPRLGEDRQNSSKKKTIIEDSNITAGIQNEEA